MNKKMLVFLLAISLIILACNPIAILWGSSTVEKEVDTFITETCNPDTSSCNVLP